MEKDLLSDLAKIIGSFQENLKAQIPLLDHEVNKIISSKSKNVQIIENHLDILLSLISHNVGKDQFIKLLDYYKDIDSEGAKFYWDEFEKEND